jgi:type IV secretion system protein VirB9
MNKYTLLTFLLIFVFELRPAMAVREAKPTAIDSRIRVMVYNPNDVFKYTGYYGYQASIEFADGEAVDTISMGDSTSWQIVPSGRRIFLKPMEDNATTNMTIITNKHTYFFELHAQEVEDIDDPEMVFNVRFIYPDEGEESAVRHYAGTGLVTPESDEDDNELDENYNYNYTMSGSELTAPIKIFDDGEFTYFQFKDKNAEVPAFFLVDSDNSESIVNYRVSGKYIVVERVASRFTLRHGNDIVCIFNEEMPVSKK